MAHGSGKLRFSLLLCALLVVASAARAQNIAATLDQYLKAQEKVSGFSGSVLVSQGGKVVFSKGYGPANREWNIANTPQTIFRLGSITKQFTSLAVLILEEQGKLSTDDLICKHLADCPAAWSGITIHHLLTHTSGIPSYTGMPDYRARSMERTTPEQMIARFRDKPLEFAPGERYRYNNSGYFLLGFIIEKVSGQSYEQFLRASIFGPLGLKSTGYDRPETILPNRASGYARRGENYTNASYLDMTQPYAAGSLYSTVEDLYKWDRALAEGKLLTPKSYEKLYTPFKDDYAYGWNVATRGNRRIIGHGGGINGFSTSITRYPESDSCIVVLSNQEGPSVPRISRDLEAILFGEPYEMPRERVAIRVDPKLFDAYVGQYELSPSFVITITREGDKLMTQATGQPKIEIFPESETKFFLKVVDAQMTFVKDASGKVTHLILHQGGRDQKATKVP